MSFDQYSETPASNYITGYFLTGMAPSSVKVAGSDIMADLASRFAALHTTSGTATAYAVTQTRQFGALVTGLEIIVLPHATNTGACTFAPDGLAAKNVFANGAAAIAGMIVQNVPAYLKYDGTQWNLMNPQRSTGSFTGQLTGISSGGSGTINYFIGVDGKSFWVQPAAAITATSNSSSCTMTGIPTSIQTTTQKIYWCVVEDNGVVQPGIIKTGAGVGTWTFGVGSAPLSSASFTSTGIKGIPVGFGFGSTVD